MKSYSILLLSLFLGHTAFAKSTLSKDLPSKDFLLIEASPSVKKASISTEINGSQFRLVSNLSSTWQRGLYFDTSDQSLSIPGLGAGPLKSQSDGYVWSVSDSGQSFRKEAKLNIKKTAEGCTMSWNFLITIQGRPDVKENGSFSYSCSSGALSTAPKPLKRADLFPKYKVGSASVGHQIDKLLEAKSADLIACVSRNVNRPSTLKESNEYSAAPQGNVVYRLHIANNRIEGSPFSTTNDSRMDSCVIDILRKVDASELNGKSDGDKYLVFDLNCKKNAEGAAEKYDCSVRKNVFDSVSHGGASH